MEGRSEVFDLLFTFLKKYMESGKLFLVTYVLLDVTRNTMQQPAQQSPRSPASPIRTTLPTLL